MALNKVFLIGNAGKDPEVHYFDSNTRKATFSLATTDRGFTRADGTVVPERTEWHSLLFWRAQAEYVERYVRKGDKLYVEGELRTRNYTDHRGIVRYVTEVWVNNLELLVSKQKSEGTVAGTSASHSEGSGGPTGGGAVSEVSN